MHELPSLRIAASNTLPTTAGSRTTTWNLRYPNAVSFPGLIYWAGTNTGPKAPLGTYTVRLIVNGQPLGWLLLLPGAPVSAIPGWLLGRRLAQQL